MLSRSGALRLLTALHRARATGALTILAYHRVIDGCGRHPVCDRDVVSCTEEEFEREMLFVKEVFQMVTFHDLLSTPVTAYRNPLIVTFDDGYADNAEIAFPILLRHGLRATFFVTTRLIGTGEWPWWEEVVHRIKSAPEGDLNLEAAGAGKLVLRDPEGRAASCRRILSLAKTMRDCDRRRMLESLREQTSVAFPHENMMMTWDQVRNLANAGMEIGSHSVSHPILSQVDDVDLDRELIESKRVIEREVGRSVVSFSYPVGGSRALGPREIAAVERAGYRFACTYISGTNAANAVQPYALRRIHAEVQDDFTLFRCKVLLPRVAEHW